MKTQAKLTTLMLLALIITLLACEDDQEDVVDCSASNLALAAPAITNPTCAGGDGSIRVEATGGSGNYTYSIGSTSNTTGFFENLDAGSYNVQVSDGDCTASTTQSLTTQDGPSISDVAVQNTEYTQQVGSITITATGGTSPYMYSVDGTNFVSENTFSSLDSGLYKVVVRDAASCEFSQDVQVLINMSLTADVQPIIETNCNNASCHGGTVSPQFTTKEAIIDNATLIKALTQSGAMPPNGNLSQEQLDRIAIWVDNGAMDN